MTTPLPILPDEIILEIQLRLPVKSLLRFKRVCKPWKTLISSPQFAKEHLQRSISDPSLSDPRLAYSTHHHYETWKVGFCSVTSLYKNPSAPTKINIFELGLEKQVYASINIVGSCNGVLCLSAVVDDDYTCLYRLWNPCTRSTSEWIDADKYGPVPAGFGYDHVHDKYKLIAFKYDADSDAKVYTFGPNSWREIRGLSLPRSSCDYSCKFVSGTLNWFGTEPDDNRKSWKIISFDLVNETFDLLSLPAMDDDNTRSPKLSVWGNSLCFSVEHNNTCWELWMMKEYGVEHSWTKLLVIPYMQLQVASRPLLLSPLYMWENCVLMVQNISYSWEYVQRCQLVMYNSNDGEPNYPIITSCDGWLDYPIREALPATNLHVYHESLVSPSHFSS